MRKVLGANPVRVTVRLPKALYEEWCRAHLNKCSDIRDALRHYLDCAALQPVREAREAKRAEHQQFLKTLQALPGERTSAALFNSAYWRTPAPAETPPED